MSKFNVDSVLKDKKLQEMINEIINESVLPKHDADGNIINRYRDENGKHVVKIGIDITIELKDGNKIFTEIVVKEKPQKISGMIGIYEGAAEGIFDELNIQQ